MPRRRTTQIKMSKKIPENIWKFLNDDLPNAYDHLEIFLLHEDHIKKLWDASKDEILSGWIRTKPGTRPSLWWRFDAPEPRQRIGGIGTPSHEVLGISSCFEFAIPTGWISEFEIKHFENLKGVAIDPSDPPLFESETSFLLRHDLLSGSEKKYLTSHRGLMKPEKVVFDEDADMEEN